MAESITVSQLAEFLKQLADEGHGDLPVYFDTEAKRFNYHMARVGRAYHEELPEPHVSLHEDESSAAEGPYDSKGDHPQRIFIRNVAAHIIQGVWANGQPVTDPETLTTAALRQALLIWQLAEQL